MEQFGLREEHVTAARPSPTPTDLSMWHKVVTMKLKLAGMNGNVLSHLESSVFFLLKKKKKTLLPQAIQTEVTTGSILGPTLWNLHK